MGSPTKKPSPTEESEENYLNTTRPTNAGKITSNMPTGQEEKGGGSHRTFKRERADENLSSHPRTSPGRRPSSPPAQMASLCAGPPLDRGVASNLNRPYQPILACWQVLGTSRCAPEHAELTIGQGPSIPHPRTRGPPRPIETQSSRSPAICWRSRRSGHGGRRGGAEPSIRRERRSPGKV